MRVRHDPFNVLIVSETYYYGPSIRLLWTMWCLSPPKMSQGAQSMGPQDTHTMQSKLSARNVWIIASVSSSPATTTSSRNIKLFLRLRASWSLLLYHSNFIHLSDWALDNKTCTLSSSSLTLEFIYPNPLVMISKSDTSFSSMDIFINASLVILQTVS